jgi:hypothetical protein
MSKEGREDPCSHGNYILAGIKAPHKEANVQARKISANDSCIELK